MSETLKMTGKVHHVGETKVFDSGFQKRLLVIEVEDGQYKNLHGFEVVKDKVDMFNGLSTGDEVTVAFNHARCREYETTWYPNFYSCWRLDKAEKPVGAAPEPAAPAVDDDDDILF